MTDPQIAGVTNAGLAKAKLASLTNQLIDDVNTSMGFAWNGTAEHEAAFFDALAETAADAWEKNGVMVNTALAMGADYSAIRKPDTICAKCADGFVVPLGAPFPTTTLAVWYVPLATKAEALALKAQPPEVITAALMAAQPAQA